MALWKMINIDGTASPNEAQQKNLRGFTPSYICIHVRLGPTCWGRGLFTLQKDYKVMVFYI